LDVGEGKQVELEKVSRAKLQELSFNGNSSFAFAPNRKDNFALFPMWSNKFR
jgi:hypothetical protein